jgi:hypothetical protein
VIFVEIKIFDLLQQFIDFKGLKCYVKEMNEDTEFLDGQMTVNKSHSIAAEIRSRIKNHKNVRDAVVHINPV